MFSALADLPSYRIAPVTPSEWELRRHADGTANGGVHDGAASAGKLGVVQTQRASNRGPSR
jgi:hypothetical protein